MTADGGSAKPETRDAILELFGRELGMLQRYRRHGHESIGMGGHPLRQSLVLCPHDRAGELAVRRVPPEAVDGERLHVDALLIHDPESFRAKHVAAAHAGKWRAFDDLCNGDRTMGVDVDHLDPPAADGDLPSRSRYLREPSRFRQVWH